MPEERSNAPAEVEDTGFVELPFPNFYSNAVQIAHGLLDVSFLFLERIDNRHTTAKARIVMSPTHAKMMLMSLTEHLQRWEERFGEIVLPMMRPAAEGDASEDASDLASVPQQRS